MVDRLNQAGSNLRRWAPEYAEPPAVLEGKEPAEHIEALLKGVIPGARVESVVKVVDGVFVPQASNVPGFDAETVTGLPRFHDVRVHRTDPGGNTVETVVWVPEAWNGRYIAAGGGGNRTAAPWELPSPYYRVISMAAALRGGFAVATTNAGNRDPRVWTWGLDEATRELDYELIENWAHRSTHDLAEIGKTVVEALHGRRPRFSYFIGSSGGGRQALMQAQRYPEDYDGVWSADPAVKWSKFMPALIWPAVVMKDLNNPLSDAKQQAFRDAVIKSTRQPSNPVGDFVSSIDPVAWDPSEVVGTPTADGDITSTDALVMRKIWEGPRNRSGEQLFFGLRPGVHTWGSEIPLLTSTEEVDGKLQPLINAFSAAHLGRWVLRDPEWDWTTVTMDNFEDLFLRSIKEFEFADADNPDLSAFRQAGGKLLLSHGLNDPILLASCTIAYYRDAVETMGGLDETKQFARLFLSPGDGHTTVTEDGPGITLSDGITALIEWVEEGIAPETLVGHLYDPATGELVMTRPIYPYPQLAAYNGDGPTDTAGSYHPEGPLS